MKLRVFALVAFSSATAWAVPTGMNPHIYGMHDMPDQGLLAGFGDCAKGWVTELLYIGTDGTCGAGDIDRSSLAAQGYGLIMRLDANGAPPLPTDPGQYAGYANAFADCVARSSGVRVWVVGNEPNIDWGHVYHPDDYGEIYRQVLAAVDALPNREEHEVLFSAMAPWAHVDPWGDWDDGLGASIDYVLANGGTIDGVAIHAYSREFTIDSITSDAWLPGRENKWHLHFRGYRDTTRLLDARGLLDLPLYITESGSACDPPCDPYPDDQLSIGYFTAMYEEIHAWNQANPRQVIRAVTPYRWTKNDDGSGRDFCIGCAPDLVADMQNAALMGRKWHESGCHEPFTDAGADAGAGDAPTEAASDAADPPDATADAGTSPDGSTSTGGAGGSPGAVPSSEEADGCACRAGSPPGSSGAWLGVLVALAGWVRRRTCGIR